MGVGHGNDSHHGAVKGLTTTHFPLLPCFFPTGHQVAYRCMLQLRCKALTTTTFALMTGFFPPACESAVWPCHEVRESHFFNRPGNRRFSSIINRSKNTRARASSTRAPLKPRFSAYWTKSPGTTIANSSPSTNSKSAASSFTSTAPSSKRNCTNSD